MERLVSVQDLMERYQCSRQTAVRYIRKMEHMERPFMVRASVLEAWEKSRTVRPPEEIRREMAMRRMKEGKHNVGRYV